MERPDLEIYRRQSELCKTFADPKRLLILNELRAGEKPVGQLAQALGLRQANVSQHLAVLRDRGIVVARREGTSVFYSLSSPKIGQACDLIHSVLQEQLERSGSIAQRLAAVEPAGSSPATKKRPADRT